MYVTCMHASVVKIFKSFIYTFLSSDPLHTGSLRSRLSFRWWTMLHPSMWRPLEEVRTYIYCIVLVAFFPVQQVITYLLASSPCLLPLRQSSSSDQCAAQSKHGEASEGLPVPGGAETLMTTFNKRIAHHVLPLPLIYNVVGPPRTRLASSVKLTWRSTLMPRSSAWASATQPNPFQAS